MLAKEQMPNWEERGARGLPGSARRCEGRAVRKKLAAASIHADMWFSFPFRL